MINGKKWSVIEIQNEETWNREKKCGPFTVFVQNIPSIVLYRIWTSSCQKGPQGIYEWQSPIPVCAATRRIKIFAISPISSEQGPILCRRTGKTLTRLRVCAVWSGYVPRSLFSAVGPFVLTQLTHSIVTTSWQGRRGTYKRHCHVFSREAPENFFTPDFLFVRVCSLLKGSFWRI